MHKVTSLSCLPSSSWNNCTACTTIKTGTAATKSKVFENSISFFLKKKRGRKENLMSQADLTTSVMQRSPSKSKMMSRFLTGRSALWVLQNLSSHNYCCKKSFQNAVQVDFITLAEKWQAASRLNSRVSQVWTLELLLFSLPGKMAFSHITQNEWQKWFALRKLKWNWACKCNGVFDSHSSTPFPNWSNDEYYSSLELSLTHPWESTRARMVLALSIAISISAAATALLTRMQKSQQLLVYIKGGKFSFAEVNCNWVT